MRRALPLIALALIAGCSAPSDENASRQTTMDIKEEAAPVAAGGAPNISLSAAPGVAFNYSYQFVLPSEAISGVQEGHAAACEKLGIARCRITGLRYTLMDEDRISASLSFKLAPDLARQFGKDGIAAVVAAKGKLVDASITGEDVGTQITASQRRSGELRAELARIEARLAAGGIGDDERSELQAQVAQLRQQLAGESQTRSAGEEMLANTPMTYSYTGDESFSFGGNPVGEAASGAWDSFVTMVSVVLYTLGLALPWLLLALLVLALWRSPPGRWVRRKLRGAPKPENGAGAAT